MDPVFHHLVSGKVKGEKNRTKEPFITKNRNINRLKNILVCAYFSNQDKINGNASNHLFFLSQIYKSNFRSLCNKNLFLKCVQYFVNFHCMCVDKK